MKLSKEIEYAVPILRWVGGKTWLVKHIKDLLPKRGFNNYHEPFLGGGSVFLAINPKMNIFLSDLNEDLMATYSTLKLDPEGIIKVLKDFKNTEEFYYQIRKMNFEDPVKRASRFIFLNQTSFNGIFRVNLKGEYNVPYGYRNKNFLEPEKLRAVSERLRNAFLFHGDFELSKSNISRGDLVFLDPPYTVSHNNNGFIKYNQKLFSIKDQERLSDFIDYIKYKNAYYILTNAAHKKIEEIFDKGDYQIEMRRSNLVGGTHAERGKTSEYLFTNIKG